MRHFSSMTIVARTTLELATKSRGALRRANIIALVVQAIAGF